MEEQKSKLNEVPKRPRMLRCLSRRRGWGVDHRISRGLKNGGEGMRGVPPAPPAGPAWPSAHPLFFREFSPSPSSSPTIISCHNVLVSFQQPSLCFLPLFGYLICSLTFPSDCKLTEGRCFGFFFLSIFISNVWHDLHKRNEQIH